MAIDLKTGVLYAGGALLLYGVYRYATERLAYDTLYTGGLDEGLDETTARYLAASNSRVWQSCEDLGLGLADRSACHMDPTAYGVRLVLAYPDGIYADPSFVI
jgi:hypothetical protein